MLFPPKRTVLFFWLEDLIFAFKQHLLSEKLQWRKQKPPVNSLARSSFIYVFFLGHTIVFLTRIWGYAALVGTSPCSIMVPGEERSFTLVWVLIWYPTSLQVKLGAVQQTWQAGTLGKGVSHAGESLTFRNECVCTPVHRYLQNQLPLTSIVRE